MKTTLPKDLFLEKLLVASHFISHKLGSESLQGVLLKTEKTKLHLYSTNLNAFYHTVLDGIKIEEEGEVNADIKRIIEFLSLLEGEKVLLESERAQVRLSQDKTVGTFPVFAGEGFPMPPVTAEVGNKIGKDFFLNNLPLILFSASKDEARPALNGVNFADMGDALGIVTTDGFRLSLLKEKKQEGVPSMLIPSGFMSEVLKYVKKGDDVHLSFLEKEKMVLFTVGGDRFFTRLVDGEFPPFERVIPAEKKSTVTVDKNEFLTKIKLVSIFARDASNIVICEFSKRGLVMRPKVDGGGNNSTQLDTVFEGEEMSVAFNYRFIQEFLNTAPEKKVEIELLRPDAPVVFKIAGRSDYIHIIMPVRLQG